MCVYWSGYGIYYCVHIYTLQEELGKLDRLRFSLQLGNIKDYKESVLTLQNKVR